jgi:hypothetical protein
MDRPVISKYKPRLRKTKFATRKKLATKRSSVNVMKKGRKAEINNKIHPESCKKCLTSLVLEYISKATIAPTSLVIILISRPNTTKTCISTDKLAPTVFIPIY